jgi:hypothetical protein
MKVEIEDMRGLFVSAVAAISVVAACSIGAQSEQSPTLDDSAASGGASFEAAVRPPGSAELNLDMGSGGLTTGGFTPPTYGGGAVLPHIRVIPVFWGSTVSSTITSGIGDFLSAVTDNNYLDWLDEYFTSSAQIDPIGRGSAAAPITITPINTSSSLNDQAIGNELGSQIRNGVLPVPDSNTMYMVYFPSGKTITTAGCGTSCGFCGCHVSTTQTIHSANVTFTFGIIPDLSQSGCSGSCGSGSVFQNTSMVTSRELVDTIVDPFNGTGWTPEISAPCSGKTGTITSSNGTTYTVQKEWSDAANACELFVPECQRVSDAFGVDANVSWGFAPPEVQSWWSSNSCGTTHKASSNLCQKASEIYGIVGNVTWGYAPTSVQQWWTANSCNTSPLVGESNCQRASDTYGIIAGVTWGSAPSYVKSWWMSAGCISVPHALNTCQKAADTYGIVAGFTWGFAPSDVQQWWIAHSCSVGTTTSAAQLCQNASNLYAIVAGSSWGGAPTNVQAWWTSQGCNVVPQCQGVSELYGILTSLVARGTLITTSGYAPSFIYGWFTGASCNTAPLFSANTCQRAADTFGIVAGQTWGFAPSNVQTWWTNNGCNAHPGSSLIKQFTAGP